MKAAVAFVLGCLAVSHAWKCSEAPRLNYALQVDAGMGMVVGTDIYKRAYFLSGQSWYRLGTVSLKHVSVGSAGTWGTDAANKVHKLVTGNFIQVNGLTMQQVDAGGDGQVVGTYPSNHRIYCLREAYALPYYGVGSVSWTNIPGGLVYFSCGPKGGCWGVSPISHVYVNRGISPTNCSHSGWIHVSGISMKMVEVGKDGSVFAVSTTGKLYQRIGITSSLPQGTAWSLIPMCMTVQHVSYDMRQLWVVTTSRLLMKCVH